VTSVPRPLETPNVPRNEGVLACDVGNSRVKVGLFDRPMQFTHGDSPGAKDDDNGTLPNCRFSAVYSIADAVDWRVIRQWTEESSSIGNPPCFLAGANPQVMQRIEQEWIEQGGAPPFEIIHQVSGMLETAVVEPETVGIDRLLNALAANAVRPPGQACILVDSGTATTVDLVDGDGVFRGGAILPGFELAANSLHAYTALLPQISVNELAEDPRRAVGTSTRRAICSGLFWGHVGAVRELLARLNSELETFHADGEMPPPLVILTGGGAPLLAEQFPKALRKPHLSLQGLVIAACRSASKVGPSKSTGS